MSSLLQFLKSLLKLINGGRSPAAQESGATLISTLPSPVNLIIDRTTKTADAIFGTVKIGNELICLSMERSGVEIAHDSYEANVEESPHFGFPTPHLTVPGRTYIELHPANYPQQLEGCVAVGQSIDGDALDNSDAAFAHLMTLLPQTFTVTITDSIPT